jgi:hypothetical protein
MDQRFKLGAAQHAVADHLGGKLGRSWASATEAMAADSTSWVG